MEIGDLKNLVFFVIAIGAWVLQAAIKRKEAQRRGGGAQAAAPSASPPPEQIEVRDVVYGRRALPARYASSASSSASSPASSLEAPPLPAASDRRSPTTNRGMAASQTLGDDITHRTLGKADLGGQLQHTTAAATVNRGQRGAHARRHLGIRRLGGTRSALRAALRWSVIIGPPLALRGERGRAYSRPRLR